MTGIEATTLVNAMDEERVDRLLALLAGWELEVNRPPRAGLLMLTVRDSFDVNFHPGEMLVTEAWVSLHGCEGYGMVLGEAPRRALAKAAMDVVFNAPREETARAELAAFLDEEADLQRVRDQEQKALIAATRVNFDLMPGT